MFLKGLMQVSCNTSSKVTRKSDRFTQLISYGAVEVLRACMAIIRKRVSVGTVPFGHRVREFYGYILVHRLRDSFVGHADMRPGYMQV